MIPESLTQKLSEIIDIRGKDVYLSQAPGRIEVLGNHTDYNAGLVISATIDRYIWVLGTQSETILLRSEDMDDTQSFNPSGLSLIPTDSWVKYAKGVYWAFERRKHSVSNITAVVKGNISVGGGLSSSAALEVALVNLIKEISGLKIHPKAAAMLAFEAERLFCGISCGVMDQFSSQLGKPDSLLGINCMNLQTLDIPFHHDASFVVIDSMVSREASDALNKRRLECIDAVKQLQEAGWEIHNLSSIQPESLGNAMSVLDDSIADRVKHIVEENARVRDGTAALKEGNLTKFGKIMIDSHASSRDLYQVSHENLDLLVDIASNQEGVFGSRMSGAGFGGNAIALVKNGSIDLFKRNVSREYEAAFGKRPDITKVAIPGGVMVRKL